MKKIILWSLAAAVTLGAYSCKNEEDDLFDQNSADRLESYKQDYTRFLSSKGGKWSMEYFASQDEPGYVFVTSFSPDGSVEIAANNKWTRTGGFDTDNSLWEVITDNGPVLTFNSYNQVFHVFSSPENIIGGPENDNQMDVDETGKGHDGDYEFMIMGCNEDSTVIKLKGKKRFNYAYLRRLDPSTDDREYMEKVSTMASNVFNKFFPKLIMVDGTGEKFVFTDVTPGWLGGAKGMIEAYPKEGDWVTQTASGNAIITEDGFRFRNPLGIERANSETDSIVVESFSIDADGSLVCKEDPSIRVNVGDFGPLMYEEGKQWEMDVNSADGELAEALTSFTDKIFASTNRLKISAITLETSQKAFVNDVVKTMFKIALSGKRKLTLEFSLTPVGEGDRLLMTDLVPATDNATAYLNTYPELHTLVDALKSGMDLSSDSRIAPVVMKASTNKGTFNLKVKK